MIFDDIITYNVTDAKECKKAGRKPNRVWQCFRKYAWCMYMGVAFAAAGWQWYDWQFHAATIPIILLYFWSNHDGPPQNRTT